MYKSDFLCTYKLHNEDEQEDMYRLQFLQAFDTNKWDDNHIEKETKILYDKICESDDIKEALNKIKLSDKFKAVLAIMGDDNYTLFKVLFMYDFFDLAHKCFCDFLNDKIIKTRIKICC